jgi:hypothetical protein
MYAFVDRSKLRKIVRPTYAPVSAVYGHDSDAIPPESNSPDPDISSDDGVEVDDTLRNPDGSERLDCAKTSRPLISNAERNRRSKDKKRRAALQKKQLQDEENSKTQLANDVLSVMIVDLSTSLAAEVVYELMLRMQDRQFVRVERSIARVEGAVSALVSRNEMVRFLFDAFLDEFCRTEVAKAGKDVLYKLHRSAYVTIVRELQDEIVCEFVTAECEMALSAARSADEIFYGMIEGLVTAEISLQLSQGAVLSAAASGVFDVDFIRELLSVALPPQLRCQFMTPTQLAAAMPEPFSGDFDVCSICYESIYFAHPVSAFLTCCPGAQVCHRCLPQMRLDHGEGRLVNHAIEESASALARVQLSRFRDIYNFITPTRPWVEGPGGGPPAGGLG